MMVRFVSVTFSELPSATRATLQPQWGPVPPLEVRTRLPDEPCPPRDVWTRFAEGGGLLCAVGSALPHACLSCGVVGGQCTPRTGLGFKVWGSRFGVGGWEFEIGGLGSGIWGLEVLRLGSVVWSLEFGVGVRGLESGVWKLSTVNVLQIPHPFHTHAQGTQTQGTFQDFYLTISHEVPVDLDDAHPRENPPRQSRGARRRTRLHDLEPATRPRQTCHPRGKPPGFGGASDVPGGRG